MNFQKYGSKRTFSSLCQRWFDSKAECFRGENLCLQEKAGGISNLQYQVPFTLNKKPKVTITIDFVYDKDDKTIYEDVKGLETREFRVKRLWLKQLHGIDVELYRK